MIKKLLLISVLLISNILVILFSQSKSSQTILLLTGASSSGKSTLAKKLRDSFDGNYLAISLDDITSALVPPHLLNYDASKEQPSEGLRHIQEMDEFGPLVKIEASPFVIRIFKMFGPIIKTIVDQQFNVIADGGFTYNIEFFYSILAALKNYNLYIINVVAPLDVMIEREKQRGGILGNARGQHATIVENDRKYSLVYDVTVNTYEHSIEQNIDII